MTKQVDRPTGGKATPAAAPARRLLNEKNVNVNKLLSSRARITKMATRQCCCREVIRSPNRSESETHLGFSRSPPALRSLAGNALANSMSINAINSGRGFVLCLIRSFEGTWPCVTAVTAAPTTSQWDLDQLGTGSFFIATILIVLAYISRF